MKNLVVVCFFIFSLIGRTLPPGYQVGEIASDFRLKDVNGKMVTLADFKSAKGFIVVFTCNTCPYAKAYEDRLIALNNHYQPKGYPVIAINPNDPEVQPGDSYTRMQERAREKGFTFPYLFDQGQAVTKKFGAARTPHVFVLQKTSKGTMVQYIGAIDNDTEGKNANKINYVENAIDALEKGERPPVTLTKAVGCGIKWKKS